MTVPDAVQIVLSEIERNELKARVRRRKIEGTDATRAAIVLLVTLPPTPIQLHWESGGCHLAQLEQRAKSRSPQRA
jgi:hypothetical protein